MYRAIDTFDLSKHIRKILKNSGFYQRLNLQGYTTTKLSEETELTIEEATQVLEAVCKPKKIPFQTGTKLLQNERTKIKRIFTLSSGLDEILNGGIALQQMTEISGTPGIGKTNLCIQLCLTVQLPDFFGGVGGKAIYVDTEGSFSKKRCNEISQGVIEKAKELFEKCKKENNSKHNVFSIQNKQKISDENSSIQDGVLDRIIPENTHVENQITKKITQKIREETEKDENNTKEIEMEIENKKGNDDENEKEKENENEKKGGENFNILDLQNINNLDEREIFINNLDPESFSNNIYYYRILNIYEQLSLNNSLKKILTKDPQIKIIVIDSVSFFLRQSFGDTNWNKYPIVSTYAQNLLKMANTFNVAVVVVNHLTTTIKNDQSELIPSLGKSWSQYPSEKVLLFEQHDYFSSNSKKNRIAYLSKSSIKKKSSCQFQVSLNGVD
ncbi:DNA repair protein rad51 [Anaeramoeba flamelloides]|uniref:DNA repair protein RAD51 homolog 3 n=1 Tax=Anaeramoeba flamelloides TaxID=1746091 RepID=A0AAV7YMD6_9EUKA|nr:DNA repair protein rad51 [Anaeramoeba flamelloides]